MGRHNVCVAMVFTLKSNCEEYRQEGYAGQEGHGVKTATDNP